MTSSRPGSVPTQPQVPSDARDAVDALRQSVADLHGELTRYGLVIWTAGNVSARVPGHNPVSYTHLTLPTNREV